MSENKNESEKVILTSLGITKGEAENGKQSYVVMGEDADGNLFYSTYLCKLCYTDSVEKAFSRLIPVPAPVVKESNEGENSSGS